MDNSDIHSDRERIIQIGHGGGGRMQGELIKFITQGIKKRAILDGVPLDALDDGATIPAEIFGDCSDMELVVSADGHTIQPIFFPGGDLGKLSVCGTVNDLIMMGAKPLAITSIYLIEEGTTFNELGIIKDSMNKYAEIADIAILAGDTKVMPKGTLKGIIINTTGLGIKSRKLRIMDSNCQTGDKIIITGTVGDHGAALIAHREGIDLETTLESDVNLLTPLLPLIEEYGLYIHAMKDPTRGGLSAALNEWARKSNKGIWLKEESIKVKPQVKAICDLLGIEPIDIANEGKALISIDGSVAEEFLDNLRKLEIGKDACIIGDVREDSKGMVIMETPLGGHRIVEMPIGEIIPRIC